jgi:hypothetical protein
LTEAELNSTAEEGSSPGIDQIIGKIKRAQTQLDEGGTRKPKTIFHHPDDDALAPTVGAGSQAFLAPRPFDNSGWHRRVSAIAFGWIGATLPFGVAM